MNLGNRDCPGCWFPSESDPVFLQANGLLPVSNLVVLCGSLSASFFLRPFVLGTGFLLHSCHLFFLPAFSSSPDDEFSSCTKKDTQERIIGILQARSGISVDVCSTKVQMINMNIYFGLHIAFRNCMLLKEYFWSQF